MADDDRIPIISRHTGFGADDRCHVTREPKTGAVTRRRTRRSRCANRSAHLDADTLDVPADPADRTPAEPSVDSTTGTGRELFAAFRALATALDEGASVSTPAFEDPVPA